MSSNKKNKIVKERKDDLVFNKDAAILEELQRLETRGHDAVIRGDLETLYYMLRCRSSIIGGLLDYDERDKLAKMQSDSRVWNRATQMYVYREPQLLQWNDFLNIMMIAHNLQFTEKVSPDEALIG